MGLVSHAVAIATLGCVGVQLAALCFAGWSDLSNRLIPDSACVIIALAGAGVRLLHGPLALAWSVALATLVFLLLLLAHARNMLGGGDVKLLSALALGQPPHGVLDLISVTALAGGVLACGHLIMRRLPRPALAPVGSSSLRRVYAAERWRILRGAPLPYGIAIACGGVVTILAYLGR